LVRDSFPEEKSKNHLINSKTTSNLLGKKPLSVFKDIPQLINSLSPKINPKFPLTPNPSQFPKTFEKHELQLK